MIGPTDLVPKKKILMLQGKMSRVQMDPSVFRTAPYKDNEAVVERLER